MKFSKNGDMIFRADRKNLSDIRSITCETIESIYPDYYPAEVVDFFIEHHSEENILKDIENQAVFLIREGSRIVGTGTKFENQMNRIFILPEFQGKGYGTMMMDYIEELIGMEYDNVRLDSSFPAFNIYLKRGYEITEYLTETVNSSRVLCYYQMIKHLPKVGIRCINLNRRKFRSVSNTHNGEVSQHTLFHYYQSGDIIEATYSGGEIIKGTLIGKFIEENRLHFSYQHINVNMEVRVGEAESRIEIKENGKLVLHERWCWLNGDKSSGCSVIEEV